MGDMETEIILAQIALLIKGDYQPRKNMSATEEGQNAVANALNKLGEHLQAKENLNKQKEKKADEILDILLKTTTLDFSQKIELSDRRDEFDAIALGINTMSEELESYIASEKKSKEEVERSAKEIEQFVFIASHDLQEPLRTISNYTGLLQKQMNNNDITTNKFIDTINTATTRMQSLIRDLLHYSRIGHNRNKLAVDCNNLLTEINTDLATLIHQTGTKIIAEALPIVSAYPTELKSLFQNLISNAIKYRKPNELPIVNITGQEKDNEWVFAIKDNGIGIEQQYHERIFIIFQKLHTQKEYPGTGIGLAHCKKIVELHSGKIWVKSKLEQGSTFYFTLSKK